MTEAYIRETYAEARANADRARGVWLASTVKAAKREAADDLEFWTNKVANMWAAAKHHGIAL